MNTLMQAVALLLPMKIERVFWDGDTLMLFSAGWSFRTESAWRVSKGGGTAVRLLGRRRP